MGNGSRPPVVLVTGIGGNVGQGILRVLRSLPYDLRLVGSNTDAVSGGNHLCDRFHHVPYATDESYPELIALVCADERVDLVIPATDQETFALACNRDHLPLVATSPADTCLTFLDKHRTAGRFAESSLPFVRSCLPSEYRSEFDSVVVKPRKGRGSRDIHFDPPDLSVFSDEFVVQERIFGREITVGLYVRRSGHLHGWIALERRLDHGATVTCWVVRDFDAAIADLVERLAAAIEIRGSCNIQLIATEEGHLVPFEVNGRVSGTASIRHHLGFPDVRWTLEDWLLDQPIDPPAVRDGSAVRLLMDVVYPGSSLDDVATSPDRPFILF